MGNIRYQLSGNQSESNHIRLLYVTSAIYGSDWRSINHTHYFSELFYVRSGEGKFIVGNDTFRVKQDDLVIVNPNVDHTEVSMGTFPLEYVVLGVEGVQFNFGFDNLSEHTIYNYHRQREELLSYFKIMLYEMENKCTDYEIVCQKLLETLLMVLIRGSSHSFSVAPTQKISKECNLVKRYIIANFSDIITLDALADMVHLSKYYLVHTFTKQFGVSPITYLNEIRIQNSKELLESTNMSILQIVQSTGFSSQSYFSQSFRKSCGQTPGEFRRIMRIIK